MNDNISRLPKEGELRLEKGSKTALLFGATGLVGSFCLKELLNNDAYSCIRIFLRKKIEFSHPRLEKHIISFENLDQYGALLQADDVFLCLGTTMAKAGSKENFNRVDYQYPYKISQMASEHGASQVFLVSSVGADPESLFYYNRVKGNLETDIQKLPFWSVHIFRPSVLLGERNENRFGERIAGILGKGIDTISGGLLKKYKPVEAEIVAKAMVSASGNLEKGVFVYPSHWLNDMADEHYNEKT